MYGVITHVKIRVINTTGFEKNLAIHFYYMPKDRGYFNGACRIKDKDGNWEVKRLELQRTLNAAGVTTANSPLATGIIKQYPIPANCCPGNAVEYKEIEFDIIADGPATLPLGIMLRRL